jgi:hypothetical protein
MTANVYADDKLKCSGNRRNIRSSGFKPARL